MDYEVGVSYIQPAICLRQLFDCIVPSYCYSLLQKPLYTIRALKLALQRLSRCQNSKCTSQLPCSALETHRSHALIRTLTEGFDTYIYL